MKKQTTSEAPMAAWKRIPTRIRKSIRGLSEEELDLKGGSDGWTIRESVHHLVEANLVASNMIVAALATDGGDFDWTWVNPNRAWMLRLGYDKADVGPAIAVLQALSRHITALVAAKPRALSKTVRLNDKPGGPRYVMTIENIFRQEVEHADEHLKVIRIIRERYSRS